MSEHYDKLQPILNRPETYFKYVNAKDAKTILVNHKLRWSSPLRFDDIYDVKRDFDWGFDIKELKEPLVNEITNLLLAENIPDLSGKPLVEWVIKKLRLKKHANVHDIILTELPQWIDEGIQLAVNGGYKETKKVWAELIPQFRILCLSAVHDNPLMWSLYSDSHKGAVLEFQSIDHLSPWQIAKQVVYKNSPPILVTKDELIKSVTGQKPLQTDDPRFWEPYILTKTTDWAYQEEWRIISFCNKGETGLFSDYRFSPRELRSVYLGYDISNEDATDIMSLLKFDFAHIKVFREEKPEHEGRSSFEEIKP
jgi:hypothetical protein